MQAISEVPLEADVPSSELLTWFVDGRLLAKASAEQRVWWTPTVGTHEIWVAKEQGASSRRTLEVRER